MMHVSGFSARQAAVLQPKTRASAPLLQQAAMSQPSFPQVSAGNYAAAFIPLQGVRFGNVIQKENIPVVDLTDYTSGNPLLRARFVKALGDGMREYGFIALKGHGINPQLFKQNYTEMGKVFGLDEATKKQYHRPEIGSQRGYLPFKAELKGDSFKDQLAGNKSRGDLKENWQVGRASNVFPVEVPTYEPEAMALYNGLERAGVKLLEALGEYLGDKGYLKSLVVDDKGYAHGTHMMRAIHYPSVPEADRGDIKPGQQVVRAAEHFDMNLITLLPESTNAGLEILRRDGSWLPVYSQEGHIIVNAGDMLALLTEGHAKAIPSTRHRVMGDSTVMNESRYSIPMFMHPNHDKELRNLASGKRIHYKNDTTDVECRDAEEFVYNRLMRHGAGTLSSQVSYEQFKKGNAQFVKAKTKLED